MASLDAMYNENKAFLDKQKQLQMEDAYVNQELMNKYLNENLAQQGLNNSGVANLYKQQLNTDYMNTRANIANQYAQDQLDLLNQYNADKKAEQDKYQKANYDIAVDKINNSVNQQYGFIDDDTMASLREYFNENQDKYGSDYRSLLESQLDLYKANEDQLSAYNQGNYQTYLDNLYTRIGDAQGITDEDYDTLVGELDTVKNKIGESNYNNALQTLTAYKSMGDVLEQVNENGQISYANYNKLKESIDQLKQQGAITTAAYNEILKNLESLKTTLEQEKADYQKQLQEGLFDYKEDPISGGNINAALYSKLSDDAAIEKAVRLGAANIVNKVKNVGKTISDLWKKYIWD